MKFVVCKTVMVAVVSQAAFASNVAFEGNSALTDSDLNEVVVPVELSGGSYNPLGEEASGGISVGDLNASKLSDEGIVAMLRAISEAYQARKIFAVQATVSGADYGRFRAGGPLRVKIIENRISDVRVVPADEDKELWRGTEDRVKGAIVAAPGDLVEMGRVEEGINLLNRHPRRYVEPYLRGEDGRLVLEYRVNQLNPYAGRFGFDTYGTNSGGELRFNGGFDFYNLVGTDDKLSGKVISDIDFETWATALAFESALDTSGRWKGVLASTLSSYDSSQLGLGSIGNQFSGDTASLAGDVSYTLYDSGNMFVDVSGGLRWLYVSQDSSSIGVQPVSSDFLLAGIGVSVSSLGRDRWWSAGLRLESNLPGVAQTESEADLVRLGRFGASRDFTYLSVNGLYGQYIDEWFGPARRAHEISFAFNAFAEITGERLPPSFLFVAGGGDQVRGYPKALVSGDYGAFLSSNYTVHLPRLLAAGASDGFRTRPRFPGDFTDWDLALSYFVDMGFVGSHSALPTDPDDFLLSTGIAASYSYEDKFRTMLSVGVPLVPVTSGRETVSGGDVRMDLSVGYSW